jgi:hypothetical protein
MSGTEKNNKEKELLVLGAIRKEVDEKFAETDSLLIGADEYPKSTLLRATRRKEPNVNDVVS